MKRALFCTAMVIALAGCAGGGSSGGSSAASNEDVTKAIAQAESDIKLAGKVDALWLSTEKHLAAAKEAQKAGNNDQAIKMAKKATKEAQAAQKQAADNANPKPTW